MELHEYKDRYSTAEVPFTVDATPNCQGFVQHRLGFLQTPLPRVQPTQVVHRSDRHDMTAQG